jgi:hypothetical protein
LAAKQHDSKAAKETKWKLRIHAITSFRLDFYHHFPSKEAFAKEVLELYVRGENERAEKILRKGKTAPLKRLRLTSRN